jgi:hypothetical protein
MASARLADPLTGLGSVAALRNSAESVQDCPASPNVTEQVLDLDSAGGAAIIDLFARVKEVEDSDGEWGAECLQRLYAWLTDVGIDPEGTFDDAVRAMRASAESHGAMRLPGFVGRVASGQPDAAAVLTTALTVLARQLGDDATAVLATRDGDVLARFGRLDSPDRTDAGT